jgi:hypothetical protein
MATVFFARKLFNMLRLGAKKYSPPRMVMKSPKGASTLVAAP